MSENPIMDSINAGFGVGKEPGEQGSVEWLMERVGYCTASRFRDVMDILKNGKFGAKHQAYVYSVARERVRGKPVNNFVNFAMERGTELEPQARMAYESFSGNLVTQVGFIHHPSIKYVGGSPDGLVDDDGIIEIKCPMDSNAKHYDTWLKGMDDEHTPQVQGLLWVLNRQYCDFISYDPDEPPHLQLCIVRVNRDDDYIAELEKQVISFLAEVDALLVKLAAASSPPAAAVVVGASHHGLSSFPHDDKQAGEDSDRGAI
ncbi:phage_rel_nuc, putative phage-type endonuclease [uncultured Caudovirales phage]|uniref:Phage_rel_nuc, putative phage-type endonuclease n=1 Tax=uncultured Caudovirales phage TaxID=2100421 RepID=A0A6J5PIQ9_9CAUD|nr:phage_rel_nuc, putative phage-type endonuclease [uncultured Caudovirales phage]CAB4182385.1 phage_rel_nuc, putative phage-type endonuclease [uncultured Caudovirales phage]CAB4213956.1 phage_rel_nuc, putative phage-type endonuclease [uncultured Caudovirales phage]CAB5228426.1 phage_rel_nuc, putative phage-type endonuclease [uncultured Caudovirales phage]